MDYRTRRILVVALVVIVALFLLSRRSFPAVNLTGQEVDLDPLAAEPVVIPTLDPNVSIAPEVNADVDANVDVDVRTITPGPLVYLDRPAGFPSGLLHGILSPFMLVASLFLPAVRMYATDNSGVLYDFGFLLGLVILLSLTQVRRFRRA